MGRTEDRVQFDVLGSEFIMEISGISVIATLQTGYAIHKQNI